MVNVTNVAKFFERNKKIRGFPPTIASTLKSFNDIVVFMPRGTQQLPPHENGTKALVWVVG
jgi:DNA topoisomerase VI subunit B